MTGRRRLGAYLDIFRLIWPLALGMANNAVMQFADRVFLSRESTWVRSLGQEDPLEYEMSTHSSILAWRIPWTEEPGGLQSLRSQRVGHD